jgi:hypothetical protein
MSDDVERVNGRAMSADALQASTRMGTDLDRRAGLDESEDALEGSALAGEHHPVVAVQESANTHGVSVFPPCPPSPPVEGVVRR